MESADEAAFTDWYYRTIVSGSAADAAYDQEDVAYAAWLAGILWLKGEILKL
jgi:hypothetical protein